MTLIASIITFSENKNWKKNVTLDPRHGALALDMEPSSLDPRQKDRLRSARSNCINMKGSLVINEPHGGNIRLQYAKKTGLQKKG